MPIYEYNCSKCGRTIEVIQKMSDAPLRTHKECGGRLTKLISAAGFQFKGTGWYVTDYAKKSGGDGQKQAASASADSSSDTKKESGSSEKSTSTTATGDRKSKKPAKD